MFLRNNSSAEILHNHSFHDGQDGAGFHYTLTEKAISIILQAVGLFLILSTVLMFLKHPTLRRMENVFHGNILVCSLFLLIVDWYLLELGVTGCEIFTLLLMLFGSAGTFSTAGIAIERYKRMVNMTVSPDRHYLIGMCVLWLTSLLLVLFPFWTMLVVTAAYPTHMPEESARVICLFTSGSYLYASLHYCVFFLCLVLIMPLLVKCICYVKIYQHVKKASMNRWMTDAAANCSRHTRVIRPTQRKGNIIQINHSNDNGKEILKHSQSFKLSLREQSILFKGVTSICLDLLGWLPFVSVWIKVSLDGFSEQSSQQLMHVILLAKTSVILVVLHYLCLNTKFKNYYLKSVFGPLLRIVNCHTGTIFPEENNSQAHPNISSLNISNAMLPLQTATHLTLQSVNE